VCAFNGFNEGKPKISPSAHTYPWLVTLRLFVINAQKVRKQVSIRNKGRRKKRIPIQSFLVTSVFGQASVSGNTSSDLAKLILSF